MMGLILGGVSAATSLFGGISARDDARAAAKQQRELGRLNAGYIQEEGAENVRRREFQIGQVEGRTKALNAASNLGGISQQRYFATMKREHQYELDWMHKSINQRARLAKKGAGMQADTTIAAGNAAMWSGIGGALNTLGRMA